MDLPCTNKLFMVTLYAYNAARHKNADVEGGRGPSVLLGATKVAFCTTYVHVCLSM